MTETHSDNILINDSADEVQLVVKGAATQTVALQQWQDSAAAVLSEIDEEGHLLVGDQDGTIDALIESHNIEDSAKPSRGLHSKGVLTGTLSSLVSWVVNELGLKGTGGISALHRALRVQATNDNSGIMSAGADVRAGDFEAINMGTNSSGNNLEMSALVAKLDNQSGAYLDKAYGLKVEVTDAGTSNQTYAIYTDNGVVHFGDQLELVAGVVLEDSASEGVIGITPRSVAPTTPTSGMMYLDNGTNRTDGLVGFRRWNGTSWDDIMDTSAIGDGNVSGPASSTDNAIARFDSTTGKLLQNSGALLDDNGKITSNALKLNDSVSVPPLNITGRSTAPTTPSINDIYVDTSGDPVFKRYNGTDWEDISPPSQGVSNLYHVESHATSDSTLNLRETTHDKLAQSFQIGANSDIEQIVLRLVKTGLPTGTLTLRVETDSSGNPSGTLVNANATTTLAESTLTTSEAYHNFDFTTSFNLSATTTYWLVLSTSRAMDAINYMSWAVDTSETYADGTMKSNVSSSWGTETADARFSIWGRGAHVNYVRVEPSIYVQGNPGSLVDLSATYFSLDFQALSGLVEVYYKANWASDGDGGGLHLGLSIDGVDQMAVNEAHQYSLPASQTPGEVRVFHQYFEVGTGMKTYRMRYARIANDQIRMRNEYEQIFMIREVHP